MVIKVANPLKKIGNIHQIKELLKRLDKFQWDIKKSVLDEFQISFQNSTHRLQSAVLLNACKVLEILEDRDAKSQLIKWFYDLELLDYKNVFRKNSDVI